MTKDATYPVFYIHNVHASYGMRFFLLFRWQNQFAHNNQGYLIGARVLLWNCPSVVAPDDMRGHKTCLIGVGNGLYATGIMI